MINQNQNKYEFISQTINPFILSESNQSRQLRLQRQKYQDIINRDISELDKHRYQKGLKQLGILDKYYQQRKQHKPQKVKDIFNPNQIRTNKQSNIDYDQLIKKYGQQKNKGLQYIIYQDLDENMFQLTDNPNNNQFKSQQHEQYGQINDDTNVHNQYQNQYNSKIRKYQQDCDHYRNLIQESMKNPTNRKFFEGQSYGLTETPYYKKYIHLKDNQNHNSYDRLVQNIRSGVYLSRPKMKSTKALANKDHQIKSMLNDFNEMIEKKSHGSTFKMLRQTNISSNVKTTNSDFC